MDAYYPGDSFIAGHDSFFHLKRFTAINKAFNDGFYPFYIDTESYNGYGYATNLFYADIMLVPFALLINVFGLINAYKILLFSSFFFCALISYYSFKKVINDKLPATIFALLYSFALYRLIDVSERGALGELLSFLFIPVVFWGAYEIIFRDYRKWYIIGIGFACLILSHLLSALMVFMVLCIFLLIYIKHFISEPKRFLYLIYAGILSILLSAFFLFPMLEQMLDNTFWYKTNPFVSDIAEKTISVRWLVYGMFSGLNDGPQRIPNIGLLLIIPLMTRVFIHKNKSTLLRFADIGTIIGFGLLFVGTSLFPWHTFPFNKLSIIQFPWRFVEIATFLFACTGSIYLYLLGSITKIRYSYGLYLIAIFCIWVSLKANGGVFQGWSGDALTSVKYDLKTYDMGNHEYIPSTIPSIDFIKYRGNETIDKSDTCDINNIIRKSSVLEFDISTQTPVILDLPLLYYKGYAAKVDGANVELNKSKDGFVELNIPRSGKVEVWFKGTVIQRVSFFISLITLLLLIGYNRFGKQKMKNN